MDYLKLDELKHGYLYDIKARNASHGIWNEKTGGFIIARTKWNDTYLFEEVHWDVDKNFGTAKPTKELEKSPFTTLEEDGILEYLVEMRGKCVSCGSRNTETGFTIKDDKLCCKCYITMKGLML